MVRSMSITFSGEMCIRDSYYIEHDYWHSVVGGIERARQELRPFNVGIDYLLSLIHIYQGDYF